VGVDVGDGLASLRARVEDDAVAAVRDSLADSHVMSVGHDLGQEAVASRRQLGQVAVVVARDHQNMDGSLRIDVPEGDRARIARNDRRRYFRGRNTAEEAVRH
jgi:hypothetical protein